MTAWLRRALEGFIVLGVRCYQYGLRPVLPAVCRFQPSCSEYMIAAVRKYSFTRQRQAKPHTVFLAGRDKWLE